MAASVFFGEGVWQALRRPALADAEEAACPLIRRIVPQLRARRPLGIVEAQQRWRRAAEARRRAAVLAG